MGMALVIREIRRVVKDVIHTALSKKRSCMDLFKGEVLCRVS